MSARCPKCEGALRRLPRPKLERMGGSEGCGWVLLGTLLLTATTWRVAGPLWAAVAFFVSFFVFARLAHARHAPVREIRHRAAMEQWERRWVCAQCGAFVTVSAEGDMLAEDGDAETDALILAGKKLDAIRRMRERTGLGLSEAFDEIEARERELRNR